MSWASFALSSMICSLDSSRSAGVSVGDAVPNDGRRSSVWHIDSRSTMTSIGPPGRGGEVHLPVAVEVVEPLVRLAARLLEMGGHLPPGLAQAGQVDVLARALAGREIGAQDPHAEAAEDLELLARGRGAAHQGQGLGQRVVRDAPA